MLQKRIEEVAFNAWPALQQMLYDGWLLRFSNGYSKRGNSINPIYPSTIDVDEKIETCEKMYAERDLPPIFRLSPQSTPPDLDGLLEARNYRKIDPTSVLYLRLQELQLSLEDEAGFNQDSVDGWLTVFHAMRGLDPNAERNHALIVQSIPSRILAAILNVGEEPVACGLGVLERGYFGFFDILTHPKHRGQGYATRLINGMLKWAIQCGAAHAYLQVERENIAAQGLYAKFGFQEAYYYWYRIPLSLP
jgi:GNAT superfamily N-acetyltransferase